MTLKEKIEIVRKEYPMALDNQYIPNHILIVLTSYEDGTGITSKMRATLDKVVDRILKKEGN